MTPNNDFNNHFMELLDEIPLIKIITQWKMMKS